LLGLEVLSDRRKKAAALFVRDILCSPPTSLICCVLRVTPTQGGGLMNFYHRTNYGQNEPVNKAILIFNEYCGLFGFRDDEVGMFFLITSVAVCLESGLIYCDCKNILDVPAEAICHINCGFCFFL
jgi:hypothetical protein